MPIGIKINFALATILLVLGVACGSKDAEPVVTRVPVTPGICLDALRAADAAISDAGDIMGVAGDALIALGNGDPQPLIDANAKLEPISDHFVSVLTDYEQYSAACRDS